MTWISVKERLPAPEHGSILVTDGENICIHYRTSKHQAKDEKYPYEMSTLYDQNSISPGEVTHWMPLPKPPEL